jgi:hypothetical protein
MPDLLSATQIAELRGRWVFDLVDVTVDPAVYKSIYNKRYSKQFFVDADLQVMARRARKRWGEAIGDGVPIAYTLVIHTAGGAGFAARPNNAAVTLVSSDARDAGVQVTIYGTTHGVAEVCKETVTLQGSTPVVTLKNNWDILLAVVNTVALYDTILGVVPYGTVTISAGSPPVTITTLDSAHTSRGWNIAGMLVAGLPITAIVGGMVPEVGLRVYDDDVTVQADVGSTGSVGFVGIGPDGMPLLDFATLSGSTRMPTSTPFARLDATLTGDVAEGTRITVLARDLGPYEGEEVLFAGIQVLAFGAYLGSDEYAAALEDSTRADQVRKAWETRIESDMKTLKPGSQRAGSVGIAR